MNILKEDDILLKCQRVTTKVSNIRICNEHLKRYNQFKSLVKELLKFEDSDEDSKLNSSRILK